MTITLADGLARKLALKPGMRVLVLEAPEGYAAALAEALPEVTVEEAQGPVGDMSATTADAVLAFATTMSDLERLAPVAIAAVPTDAPLWLLYPKGGSGVTTDLKRDLLPPVLARLSYRPVSQIALDPTWSALRFRPSEVVGR